jgi:hypothetical protein
MSKFILICLCWLHKNTKFWIDLVYYSYLNISHTVRNMKVHVFCGIMPCRLFTNSLEELSASIFKVKGCLTLNMEAGSNSETLATTNWNVSPRQAPSKQQWRYQSTHCHISEALNLYQHHCGTLKSCNKEHFHKFLFAGCVILLLYLWPYKMVQFNVLVCDYFKQWQNRILECGHN